MISIDCFSSYALMYLTQVEKFAKLSFEKNEESKEKPVYVGVDDDNSKVRNCFTRLFNYTFKSIL